MCLKYKYLTPVPPLPDATFYEEVHTPNGYKVSEEPLYPPVSAFSIENLLKSGIQIYPSPYLRPMSRFNVLSSAERFLNTPELVEASQKWSEMTEEFLSQAQKIDTSNDLPDDK
ncbi:hypothetical protein [Capybara microvirus Cap1_SP_148]|nr:hypothetical protein [Capybara microvirus Cap1_SP_148]